MATNTPDPGARTYFINSTPDVLAWVSGKLTPGNSDAWRQYVFAGSNYALLFKYLKTLKVSKDVSALVAVYTGSQYGNVPRRSATFSVLSISCVPLHRDEAQNVCATLNDNVISLLDQQLLDHAVCRAAFDRGVDLPGTELNCWETGFTFLDH